MIVNNLLQMIKVFNPYTPQPNTVVINISVGKYVKGVKFNIKAGSEIYDLETNDSGKIQVILNTEGSTTVSGSTSANHFVSGPQTITTQFGNIYDLSFVITEFRIVQLAGNLTASSGAFEFASGTFSNKYEAYDTNGRYRVAVGNNCTVTLTGVRYASSKPQSKIVNITSGASELVIYFYARPDYWQPVIKFKGNGLVTSSNVQSLDGQANITYVDGFGKSTSKNLGFPGKTGGGSFYRVDSITYDSIYDIVTVRDSLNTVVNTGVYPHMDGGAVLSADIYINGTKVDTVSGTATTSNRLVTIGP